MFYLAVITKCSTFALGNFERDSETLKGIKVNQLLKVFFDICNVAEIAQLVEQRIRNA